MDMTPLTRAGAVAIAAGTAGAVLCATAGAASAAPHRAAHRAAVTYTIASNGTVSGPAKLAPGLVKIKIKGGSGQHALQIVKPKTGRTESDLLNDLTVFGQKNDPRPLERDFAAYGGGEKGSAVVVSLSKGIYFALDTDGAPSAKTILKIKVGGKTQNAAKPKSTTLTAVKMMSWSKKPASMPHKGYVTLANKANTWHFLVLQQVKKGTTIKQVEKALTDQNEAKKIFINGKGSGYDNGVVSPGRSETGNYSLNKGTFVMACFWTDPKTGKPHALEGMVRLIKLT